MKLRSSVADYGSTLSGIAEVPPAQKMRKSLNVATKVHLHREMPVRRKSTLAMNMRTPVPDLDTPQHPALIVKQMTVRSNNLDEPLSGFRVQPPSEKPHTPNELMTPGSPEEFSPDNTKSRMGEDTVSPSEK